jgi:hypothetical protein
MLHLVKHYYMVPLRHSLALVVLFFTALPYAIPQNKTGASVFAEFVASTPCNNGPKALTVIPAGADCEFMKWKLTLYHDPVSKAPTEFRLHCTYGMTKPNTNGFTNGNSVEVQGKWSIVKEVYQLHPANGGEPIQFLKLNDALLHLLDTEKRLMVGNPGWSYTFNKIK